MTRLHDWKECVQMHNRQAFKVASNAFDPDKKKVPVKHSISTQTETIENPLVEVHRKLKEDLLALCVKLRVHASDKHELKRIARQVLCGFLHYVFFGFIHLLFSCAELHVCESREDPIVLLHACNRPQPAAADATAAAASVPDSRNAPKLRSIKSRPSSSMKLLIAKQPQTLMPRPEMHILDSGVPTYATTLRKSAV